MCARIEIEKNHLIYAPFFAIIYRMKINRENYMELIDQYAVAMWVRRIKQIELLVGSYIVTTEGGWDVVVELDGKNNLQIIEEAK